MTPHIYDSYLWEVSLKSLHDVASYKDIASREMGVNRQTTDGRTDDPKTYASVVGGDIKMSLRLSSVVLGMRRYYE